MCHLLYYCLYFQRWGAKPRRFLMSFQLTLSCEVADNHSALRGCDYGAKKAFRGLPLGHPCLMRGARTPLATEEKRAFRGLPLGHPCPMRGARTPLATEGKRPSGWPLRPHARASMAMPSRPLNISRASAPRRLCVEKRIEENNSQESVPTISRNIICYCWMKLLFIVAYCFPASGSWNYGHNGRSALATLLRAKRVWRICVKEEYRSDRIIYVICVNKD